jgi:hypothetical protein
LIAVRRRGHEDHRELFCQVCQVCGNLGYGFFCEVIETSEQVEILCLTECRYVKGYFYGKAMPLSDVLALSLQNPDMPNT